MRDFTPVVLLAWSQSVLVANPSFPASSVTELIALAKAKPGKITIGSSGNGSSAQLRPSCSSRRPACASCTFRTRASRRRSSIS